MSEPAYCLEDLGDRRVVSVNGRDYPTTYSARVVQMLVERKGASRTPQYFAYKQTRGHHFLDPLFAYLGGRGSRELHVLEVGCSFGHITEYLAECPEVHEIATFDTDPAFAAITTLSDGGGESPRTARGAGTRLAGLRESSASRTWVPSLRAYREASVKRLRRRAEGERGAEPTGV